MCPVTVCREQDRWTCAHSTQHLHCLLISGNAVDCREAGIKLFHPSMKKESGVDSVFDSLPSNCAGQNLKKEASAYLNTYRGVLKSATWKAVKALMSRLLNIIKNKDCSNDLAVQVHCPSASLFFLLTADLFGLKWRLGVYEEASLQWSTNAAPSSPIESAPDSLLLHASLKDEREAPLSHAMKGEEAENLRQMIERQ